MKQVGVALALGLVGAIIVVILLRWFDPAQTQLRNTEAELARQQAIALAPLWLGVKRALVTSLGVTGVSIALLAAAIGTVALLSVPNGIRATWLRSWLVKPGRDTALYPALAEPDGAGHVRILHPVNELGAQRVSALTAPLKPDVRLQGSAVRQVLRPTDEQYMLPDSGPTQVTPEMVLDFDPQHNPHWALIGETGSGKSSASYLILDAIRRRLHAEFIVCERDGINWNQQASTITIEGYAAALDAVEEERLRRAELLRQADVDHISKIPNPPPYLAVVIEEAESVYAALALQDKNLSKRYKTVVRDLASMGRKEGILLMVCTQTGTSDVFDIPTRKNLSNKLFFRSEPAVGDSWGIPRDIGLPTLPTGTAYSLRHGATVAFPKASRPVLPMSHLYKDEPVLALPADAESDGIGEDDMPDGPAQPLQRFPAEGGDTTGYRPYPSTVATVATGLQLPKRQPTPVEAAAMRAHYARTGSKTAVCRKFYGYKDGDTWGWVDLALEGRI